MNPWRLVILVCLLGVGLFGFVVTGTLAVVTHVY
jgi:hypothetical protein